VKPKFFIRDPKPGMPLSLRGIAKGLSRLAYAVENLDVFNGHVEWTMMGKPIIVVDDVSYAEGVGGGLMNFSCSAVSSGVVTVRKGTLRIHNVGNYAVAETEITLAGDTAWVYLEHARSHLETTIVTQSETEPESSATVLRIPLAKYTLNEDGDYELEETCHEGDVNIDAILR